MIVLNKDVEKITFEEVEKFCVEKRPEGVEIDYKKDLTNKQDGLSKHFASFGLEQRASAATRITWCSIRSFLVEATAAQRLRRCFCGKNF